MTTATLSDFAGLLEAARANNRGALNALFRAVRPDLCDWAQGHTPHRLRARFDPADLAQEALLRAVADFASFRGHTPDEFLAWLRAILRYQALRMCEHAKAAKRDPRRECPLNRAPAPLTQETPSQLAVAAEVEERLKRSFRQLPEDDRRVIELREFQHRPFPEIARQLGRSAQAVRRLHARALLRWRKATEMVP